MQWKDYLEPSNRCGYTQGKVTYGNASNEQTYTPGHPDAGHVVKKGEPVKFKIDMLTTGQYRVASWKIDGEVIVISKLDGSITLSNDKTLLTIASAEAKDYEVSVVTERTSQIAENEATINIANSTIEDVTTSYSAGMNVLTFTPLSFSSGTSTVTANVPVPYTNRDTNLKVHIEAGSRFCTGEDEGGASWGSGMWEKDYTLTLLKDEASKQLKFTIIAEDGHSRKEHIITFTRGEKYKVTVQFEHELLTDSTNVAEAKISWHYGKKEMGYMPGGEIDKAEINVAKDYNAKIKITCVPGVIVASATSGTSTPHAQLVPNGGELDLTITNDFTLKIKLMPEASVKWKNYVVPNATSGYTGAKIEYIKPGDPSGSEDIVSASDAGRAVKKGSIVEFKIEGLNSATHFVEKWIVNGNDVAKTKDNFELNNDNSILKINNADGHYEVEVVIKKLCTVEVHLVRIPKGTNSYSSLTDHNCNIAVLNTSASPNTSIPAQDSTANKPSYVFTKIRPGTELKITATLDSSSNYEIKSWSYVEGSGRKQPFGGSPINVRSKVIEKDTTINVILRKKEFELDVSFDGVKAGYDHSYTLAVKDVTTSPETNLNGTSATGSNKTTYNVLEGHKVKIKANAGTTIKYAIEKWQIKKDGDSNFADIPTTAYTTANKDEVEITMDKNAEVQIVLIPQYKFKFTKRADATAGQLEIDNISGGTSFATLVTNGQEALVKTSEDIYFKVSGLGTDNMVVSYTRKAAGTTSASEMNALFDNAKGLWKLGKEKLDLNPGDEFEVEIARVQRILFSVRDFDNDSALYNDDSYKITVEKTGTNADHLLFPKFSNNKVEITKDKISTIEKYYPIYITKGTKLKVKTTGLKEKGKEIGEWRNNGTVISNSDINENPNEDDKRVGKDDITYKHNVTDYADFQLFACIRDETIPVMVSIKAYGSSDKTNDATTKVAIYDVGGSGELGNMDGTKDLWFKRIKKRKTLRFTTLLPSSYGSDSYRFAGWYEEGKRIISSNTQYEVDLSFKTSPIRLVSAWTKCFIVEVHGIEEADKDNFPNDIFASPYEDVNGFGNVKVEVLNSTGAVQGSESAGKVTRKANGNTKTYDDILVKFSGNSGEPYYIKVGNVGGNNYKQVRLTWSWSEEPEKENKVGMVYWKFSFDGVNMKFPKLGAGEEGKPNTQGKVFTITEMRAECPVLHIWLEEITKKP